MVKTVEVKKWKEQTKPPEYNEKGEMISDGMQEITTLNMLSVLVNAKDPNTMPKGLDHFRTFNRLAKAFDDAEKTGKLVLDDADYKFLKDIIEKEIPSSWGRSKDVVNAVEAFMNA